MRDRILVFIPMYNCAAQIPRVIAQLSTPEAQWLISGVVCIDNRSSDGTIEAASAALADSPIAERIILRNDDNYGLGGSHKVALSIAQVRHYDYLIVLHGDDQGSINDLLPLVTQGAHRSVDFLLGARFMESSKLEGYSLLRTYANHFFNVIFSAVAGKRLYDLGSGLNMFRVGAFKSDFHIRYRDNLTFNYFLVFGICDLGFKFRFFPLTWREDDQVSNARLFQQGLQMLNLLRLRIMNKSAFHESDHREKHHEAYTSTVIQEWPSGDCG